MIQEEIQINLTKRNSLVTADLNEIPGDINDDYDEGLTDFSFMEQSDGQNNSAFFNTTDIKPQSRRS